ncbi:MAG: DUF5674 family protein [Gemmatimonadales bacterium]
MPPNPVRLLHQPVSRSELAEIAAQGFGDMVKAVVDVRRAIMAVGGELLSDAEAALLDDRSLQVDLWGINLYPSEQTDDWIEFDSMINVRPAQGNRSRSVEDGALRADIVRILRSNVIN